MLYMYNSSKAMGIRFFHI